MTTNLLKNLSGFADEAGDAIDTQIQAHSQLGWRFLDLRKIGGREITEISNEEFADVVNRLERANLHVSSVGSPIGNRKWSVGEPLEKSLMALEFIIPRMRRLGTRFIRVMTYANDGRSDELWKHEAVTRMRELAKMAEDEQIFLVVENCAGWAGLSKENYRVFFEMVDSPALKAVFDLGNPAARKHRDSAWQWYEAIKPYLMQVHIKVHTGGVGGRYTWPDSGASNIMEILQDLSTAGFDGFLSIEPHMGFSDDEHRFKNYIEYGSKLMEMLKS